MLVLASIVTALGDLEARGVGVLGEVQSGLPQFAVPILGVGIWLSLVPSALASRSSRSPRGCSCRASYAGKRGYQTEPDRDLLAFGAGNVAAGLSSSFAIDRRPAHRGDGRDRLAPNCRASCLTPLPGLLLFGTAVLEVIPSPAIGAVVAVAVLGLLGLAEFAGLWRRSHFEFAIGVVCFVGVLLIGPLGGLGLAFVLSLINLARRAANPPVDVIVSRAADGSLLDADPNATQSAPGVIVLRFAAPIFFANGAALVDRSRERRRAGSDVAALVLDSRSGD